MCQRPDWDDLPRRDWKCEECGAINSDIDAECQYCEGPADLDELIEEEAYDLELYAIHTGSLYERHKELGRQSHLDPWLRHVRYKVVGRYSREIEPVRAKTETVEAVARSLKEYYERHVKELA